VSERAELDALVAALDADGRALVAWLSRHPRLLAETGPRARALFAATLAAHTLRTLRRLVDEWLNTNS
jgi:hypothetical protein